MVKKNFSVVRIRESDYDLRCIFKINKCRLNYVLDKDFELSSDGGVWLFEKINIK
jgi:hypothetical protein